MFPNCLLGVLAPFRCKWDSHVHLWNWEQNCLIRFSFQKQKGSLVQLTLLIECLLLQGSEQRMFCFFRKKARFRFAAHLWKCESAFTGSLCTAKDEREDIACSHWDSWVSLTVWSVRFSALATWSDVVWLSLFTIVEGESFSLLALMGLNRELTGNSQWVSSSWKKSFPAPLSGGKSVCPTLRTESLSL